MQSTHPPFVSENSQTIAGEKGLLSVIIITLNEQDSLATCLQSVIDIAQEIIVVDSGSQDNTVAIAKQFGARVIINAQWPGFGAQKNLALSYASCPCVLSIDADESLTPELHAEIVAALEQSKYDGYLLPRQSYFLGKRVRYSGWYPDYVLRLFRRTQAQFSNSLVHESVLLQGKIGKLKCPLQHDSYRDRQEVQIKTDRYALAGAQQMYQQGKSTFRYQALIHAIAAWWRTFILKLGLLDGYTGWQIAQMNAHVAYKKYRQLYNWKQKTQKNNEDSVFK